MNKTTTGWEPFGYAGSARVQPAPPTHCIWKHATLTDVVVYHILRTGQAPGAGAGGYFDLGAALRAKGLVQLREHADGA